jgi:hypothetical protein
MFADGILRYNVGCFHDDGVDALKYCGIAVRVNRII